MPHDPRKYVYDIWQAAHHILDFAAGKSFEDYQADLLLRSGVERQFEIIGEALNQLARIAPEIAARVPEHRRIISFRNLPIHGYATIDARIVWGVIEAKLPELAHAAKALLEAESGG